MTVQRDRDGRVQSVTLRGRRHLVAAVQEVWRIDDEWWRSHPIARTYCRVSLDDGRLVTIFRDDRDGTWWTHRT